MRSSCASLTWSRCENDQRSPLIGRSLLIDLVLVEESLDRRAHLDVRIDIDAALGERQQDAPHLGKVFRPGVGLDAQQLGGDRRKDRLAPTHVVEVIGALERLEIADFADHRVDLRGRRRLPDRRPEQADVELAAVREVSVRLVMLGAHPAPAGVEPRGEAHGVEIAHELAGIREPRLLVLQRHARRDESDAAGAAHEAGWFAAGVFFDPAALRVRRAGVDLRRDQRYGIEIAVVIHRLQHHRIVGSDAVEFLQREAARLVGELLFGPAAENHDPFAGGGAAHPIGEHLERLLPRGHAVESSARRARPREPNGHGCRSVPG